MLEILKTEISNLENNIKYLENSLSDAKTTLSAKKRELELTNLSEIPGVLSIDLESKILYVSDFDEIYKKLMSEGWQIHKTLL